MRYMKQTILMKAMFATALLLMLGMTRTALYGQSGEERTKKVARRPKFFRPHSQACQSSGEIPAQSRRSTLSAALEGGSIHLNRRSHLLKKITAVRTQRSR